MGEAGHHYRCYFLGRSAGRPSGPSPDALGLIEAAVDLRAETDDEARALARAMYRQRRNRIHGFELWQGDRLVYREPGSPGKGRATGKST